MKEEIPIEFYKEYVQYCKKSAVEILNEDIRNNRDWECEIIQAYQKKEKAIEFYWLIGNLKGTPRSRKIRLNQNNTNKIFLILQ